MSKDMLGNEQIFKNLEFMAQMAPAPFYWADLKTLRVLGANKLCLEAMGARKPTDVIGKTPYEYYPKEIADHIVSHVQDVVKARAGISQEDMIKDITTGKIRYYTAVRAPIFDNAGEIIGIVGISMEVTAEKEAEILKLENQRLTLENKTQKIAAQLEEHQKFRKIADQMAHDLGSPLMALSVLTNNCEELPEVKRNMLRESASSIREIAGSLLSQYKPIEEIAETDISNEVLVYAVIEQIIMEKQHEYQGSPIKFSSNYSKDSKFKFIECNVTSFKRMLSNLINNSVEAIGDNAQGFVTLKLDTTNQNVTISITDNGKGMSQYIIGKIMNKKSTTSGKENGHGIGFSQIHETLHQANSSLAIQSVIGTGTVIFLTFPRIPIPDWLVETITINSNDTIIILDDDNSIHGAWDIRFEELLKTTPSLTIKHFTQASELIAYVRKLSETEKQHILLLTDYELLKQNFNGLNVIGQTQIKHSILVTSHYNNQNIRQQANNIGTKLLPKILASFVPIKINHNYR